MSLNTIEFLAGQAWASIRRNPLIALAATTNVAVSLAILGAFFVVAVNLRNMADIEARSAVVTCTLTGEAPAKDVMAALLADVRIDPARTRFVPKAEGLRLHAEKYGQDLNALELLGPDLEWFPDYVIIHVIEPEHIDPVCRDVQGIDGVDEAWYHKEVTEKILLVANGVETAGLLIGAVLILATLTVIGTTIRLTIYARRREIRIMQLVGATRWFIRLPFLLEGVFHGVAGGVLAASALLVAYTSLGEFISASLDFITLVSDARFLALFGVGLVVGGVLFGIVGTLSGIRRYLQVA